MRQTLKRRGGLLRLWPLAILPLMTSCQTLIGGTRYIDTTCETIKIVHYSREDTSDTKKQVYANNQALHALCD